MLTNTENADLPVATNNNEKKEDGGLSIWSRLLLFFGKIESPSSLAEEDNVQATISNSNPLVQEGMEIPAVEQDPATRAADTPVIAGSNTQEKIAAGFRGNRSLFTPVGKTGNHPVTLLPGESAKGVIPQGVITYNMTTQLIGVRVGNHGCMSNGQLQIQLSNGTDVVTGLADVATSDDNALFYIPFDKPLEIAINRSLEYVFSYSGGTVPIALWAYPTVEAKHDQNLSGPNGKLAGFGLDLHLLQFGKDACEIYSNRFETCNPLQVYTTPSEPFARVSMITDSIGNNSLYGGVGTAIIFSALLAEEKKAQLRIITRAEPAQRDNLSRILSIYGITLTREVQFVFAEGSGLKGEFDIFDDETFITTSWWTTAATMGSVPHEQIVYLLQEDERMFYAYGDDRLKCEGILRDRTINFVLNSKLLFDHLVLDGFENIELQGSWFEPSFPKSIYYPRKTTISPMKRNLMFYARPNNLRNLFYFGVEVLDRAIKQGVIDLDRWNIILVGKDIPQFAFSGAYIPQRMQSLSWSDYAELAGKTDLGFCLMYTPHPSYPPLDLAASGAVVLTNRFGNKVDLGNYSRNIVVAELTLDSMISSLERAIRLAEDEVQRSKNFYSNTLLTDWRVSLATSIKRFSEAKS